MRFWATVFILIYLIGYVGVNLFTMGKVLNALVGWQIPVAALVVAVISCTYVTAGGQTSVIMTDLLQGVMLLFTGLIILVLGIDYLGGFDAFWTNLPRDRRLAFPNFNEDPSFPSVGIFWQDAIANTAMFYFLNQGIIMRFLAAKSLAESRKAALAHGRRLDDRRRLRRGRRRLGRPRAWSTPGICPTTSHPARRFYVATELLSRPGVFGLILAALTAALMSTVDTLITAVAAIVVNDVYKPYIRPEADGPRAAARGPHHGRVGHGARRRAGAAVHDVRFDLRGPRRVHRRGHSAAGGDAAAERLLAAIHANGGASGPWSAAWSPSACRSSCRK